MKKYIAITALSLSVAILSLTAGCSNGITSEPSGSEQSSMPNMSGGTPENNSTEVSQSESESSVPEISKGEPTFLICPDGTSVYTSEISEIYKGAEEWGDKEAITLEQAEQLAQDRSGFSVKCDGFAYGFTSEETLNRVENPEMFKDVGNGKSFEFLGEDFDVNAFEGKYSTDYTRIKVGDKFGSLTVKSAYTLFTGQTWFEDEDYSDIPGVYLSGAGIEFDGEIEMTGYVIITPMDTLYNEGGDMEFIPNEDSSVIIPKLEFFLNKKARCVCHFPQASYSGYCGTSYDLGNMYEVDCDTSGLHPGDVFVKVKITAENVTSGQGGVRLKLKNIEVL